MLRQVFGYKRNEETLESVLYYDRVPPLEGKNAVILDPMVATGDHLIMR